MLLVQLHMKLNKHGSIMMSRDLEVQFDIANCLSMIEDISYAIVTNEIRAKDLIPAQETLKRIIEQTNRLLKTVSQSQVDG